ncbi:MAG TPA: rhodanese-like domain-containing protein [Bacteroidetes bacterium]|nr:rhodanese-like domain-containing protein [Bacteroidota bacterium]
MDLKTIINQPQTTIVDVREPYEFAAGHANGAINIPVGSIMARLDELRNSPKPIVLYCASGNRSGMAAAILKANGIEEVYNGGGLHEMEYYLAATA